MNRPIWIIILVVAGFTALTACGNGAAEAQMTPAPTIEVVEEGAPLREAAEDSAETGSVERVDTEENDAAEEEDNDVASESQPESSDMHFQECAFRTGSNAVIAVTVEAVTNSGLELEAGDEVAVFTPNGKVCAGVTRWEGQNIAVTAWGDDEQTDKIDGLQEGDEMVFHFWDQSQQEEIIISAISYELGDGIYTLDGIYVVSEFTLE